MRAAAYAEAMPIAPHIETLTGGIIGAAMRVHTVLGPGALESAYRACLAQDLRNRRYEVRSEVPLALVYEGLELAVGYRLDLLVEGIVVVEVKAVERLAPVHARQLQTYLKLTGCSVGLLLNFNADHMRDGIARVLRR